MPASRPRLRALVVGAAAIALVTIGAGGTLAASTPTVYACYNANGQVAMASIPQCKLPGGGQLVLINAAGLPGLPGATGPAGPTGPTGPEGPTGATGPAAPLVRHTGTLAWSEQATWTSPGSGDLSIVCGVAIIMHSPSVVTTSHIWAPAGSLTGTSAPMPPAPQASLVTPISNTIGDPVVTMFTAVAGGGVDPLVTFQGYLSTGTQDEGCYFDVTGAY